MSRQVYHQNPFDCDPQYHKEDVGHLCRHNMEGHWDVEVARICRPGVLGDAEEVDLHHHAEADQYDEEAAVRDQALLS
jgi:hypothetical protein